MENNLPLHATSTHAPRPAIIEGDLAKIPLGVGAKGGYAIVDVDMAWLADKHKWTLDVHGYAISRINRKKTYLHHLIIGKAPALHVVDHMNRNRLDNRRKNLRYATYSESIYNQERRKTKLVTSF